MKVLSRIFTLFLAATVATYSPTKATQEISSAVPALVAALGTATLGAFIGYKIALQTHTDTTASKVDSKKTTIVQKFKNFIAEYRTQVYTAIGGALGFILGGTAGTFLKQQAPLDSTQLDKKRLEIAAELDTVIDNNKRQREQRLQNKELTQQDVDDMNTQMEPLIKSINDQIAKAESITALEKIKQQFTAQMDTIIANTLEARKTDKYKNNKPGQLDRLAERLRPELDEIKKFDELGNSIRDLRYNSATKNDPKVLNKAESKQNTILQAEHHANQNSTQQQPHQTQEHRTDLERYIENKYKTRIAQCTSDPDETTAFNNTLINRGLKFNSIDADCINALEQRVTQFEEHKRSKQQATVHDGKQEIEETQQTSQVNNKKKMNSGKEEEPTSAQAGTNGSPKYNQNNTLNSNNNANNNATPKNTTASHSMEQASATTTANAVNLAELKNLREARQLEKQKKQAKEAAKKQKDQEQDAQETAERFKKENEDRKNSITNNTPTQANESPFENEIQLIFTPIRTEFDTLLKENKITQQGYTTTMKYLNNFEQNLKKINDRVIFEEARTNFYTAHNNFMARNNLRAGDQQ